MKKKSVFICISIDEVSDKTREGHNSGSGKKLTFRQYFEPINGIYLCTICGSSVCKTSTREYVRHLRDKHPEICENIVPYVSWAAEQEEELVRLVGESIRKNKGNVNLNSLYSILNLNSRTLHSQHNIFNTFIK